MAVLLFHRGVIGAAAAEARHGVQTSFLYSLSNFSGPIPYNWANISVDEWRDEIYVVDTQGKGIGIFNETGMEVYRFGDDGGLGVFLDVAVGKDGNIFGLVRTVEKTALLLFNFRGEPLSELVLKNLPPDFSGVSPNRIFYRGGRLYLLDRAKLLVVVTDESGRFLKGYDVGSLLELEEEKRADTEIDGFSVDREGNILFTIPVLFSAFTLSPEGKVRGFGHPGSAPGGFGIVGDIVADERGHYYVADRLKSAVLIFDRHFVPLKEFGYRGSRPDNLIGPKNLALDAQGRLYVSQLRNRGISVFKVRFQ